MANAAYAQGTVTIGTTPTLICSPGGGAAHGVLLSNSAGAVVFLGGSNVSAAGANAGVQLPASGTLTVPASGVTHDLYGIVASVTSAVSFLFAV